MSRSTFWSSLRGLRDASITSLLAALGLGLAFPALFAPLQEWSTWILQLIFLLTSLRIDLRAVAKELHAWPTLLWVSCCTLLIVPMATYWLVAPFFPQMALAVLLLAAMPAGMTSPLLAQLLGLNTSLALVLTVITSLAAPVTVPMLIGLFSGETVALGHLFLTLLQVIIVPFILAQIVRAAWPSGVRRALAWQKPVALSLVALLIAAIAGRYHAELWERFDGAYLLGLGVLTLFFLLLHVLGYWIAWWRRRHDRLTVMLCVVYMNFTLAIFLAEKFFRDPDVIFYTILSIIPWNISLVLFHRATAGRSN